MNNEKVPSFVLEGVKILGYEAKEYVSKKTGKNVSFKTVVTRYKGKILKFRVSQELDLEEYNDREVSLELGIDTFGDSLEPILKVLSVE